ncbi:transposase-like protein [Glaciihabitans sp. UYNi722]
MTPMLARSYPKVAVRLDEARHYLLAFASFPKGYWNQIWPTNRWNGSEKRSTPHRVVGVFPNPAALLRCAWQDLV